MEENGGVLEISDNFTTWQEAADGPDETRTNFPKQNTSQAVKAPLINVALLRAQRDKERSTETFVKDVLQRLLLL